VPGMAMFLCVLGFNLLGDGLRDFFDPHLRD
jgi:peptide/nickel transport system permease protein